MSKTMIGSIISVTGFLFAGLPAHSQDLFSVSIPLGIGSKEQFELCQVIGDFGGIDGSIDCRTVQVPLRRSSENLTFFNVIGDEGDIRYLFGESGGNAFSSSWSSEQLPELFSGDTDSVSVYPNTCEVILLPENCACEEGASGQPIITCGVLRGGEVPWPLVVDGMVLRLNGALAAPNGFSLEGLPNSGRSGLTYLPSIAE